MKALIERPVAVAMIYLALLTLGIFSFLNTPIELAPGGSYPRLDIEASWPGVSPEAVQALVTAPLEEAAASVKGVRRVSSRSQSGGASITLEIDPRAERGFVETSLREAVGRLRAEMPFGVRPVVQPYVPEDFRVSPFMRMTVSGPFALMELRALVKDRLEYGLGSIRGVSSVEVAGGSDPEVRIVLDENRLEALGIRPFDVGAALDAALITRPAGRVRRAGREYIFKLAKTADTLPDLGRIAVGRAGAVPVRLGDVADVVQASGEIRSIARVNGQPTVMLTVMKENGANALKVAGEVRRRLAAIRKGLPESLVFRTVDDESAVIGRNLRHLGLLAGFIVVLVFLMVFAAIRRLLPSLLILSSVAFSVLITFNLLYVLRIPLNMLTLGALALGFGMFVDNSIVVFENALRLREQGLAPARAALQGAREVFVAVLASTLTTVGVFACFPFFQGRLRSYYLPLALVMTSALMASLAVSFSLIPALAPRLLRKVKPTTSRSSDRRLFARTVGGLLRRPALTVLAAGALLFFSHRWFRAEVPIGDFFNWLPQERLTVSLSLPHGSDIETLDAIVRRFEDIVLSTDHDKEMTADIGTDSAYLNITFPPEVEHSAGPYILKDRLIRLATEFAGVSMFVYGFSQEGYYSSAETSTYFESGITFHGYDLRRLKGITDGVTEGLLRNPRIREVRAVSNRYGWWGEDTFEVVLRPDREALRRYDVHPGWLRAQVLSLIGGRFGSAHRGVLGGRESDIVVTLPAAERTDLRRLQSAIFRTGSGAALRLGDVLKAEERPVTGFIEREDRRFVRQLMWEFRGPAKAAGRFKKAVFAGLDLPPGFSADLDEERFLMTREEKGQVTLALLIALAVIFMILAALYESFVQPFIVMMAVPLALVGVFAVFVVAGARFDSAAYIGVLLMAGIVVNNAILLVDHINLKRREGMELVTAIVQGTRERVRPILMTTATTVFGMLPMLLFHAEAGKSDIWSSLALCTAGGLTASTPLILTVIPVLYLVAERLRPRLARAALEARAKWREG